MNESLTTPTTTPTTTLPTTPTVAPASGRHRRRVLRAVAPAALCLVLGTGTLACGGSDSEDAANDAADELAEQIAESGAGDDADVDIDSESGKVDVSTPDGDMSFGDGTELPEDFPSDIPLPEDYSLTSAMSTSSGDSAGWSVAGELPDATDSAFDDLVAEFTSAGWTKSSETTTETGGGTASTAMLDNGTWQVIVSVQVGVEDVPDSFSYLVSAVSG